MCPVGSIIYYLNRYPDSYNYDYISLYCVNIFNSHLMCINEQASDEFGLVADDTSPHRDIVIEKGAIETLMEEIKSAIGHELKFQEL